jgi:hypothetical protein
VNQGLGGIDWRKNRGSKISCYCPFKENILFCAEFLDKKSWRKCHLSLNKRWSFLHPFLSVELDSGSSSKVASRVELNVHFSTSQYLQCWRGNVTNKVLDSVLPSSYCVQYEDWKIPDIAKKGVEYTAYSLWFCYVVYNSCKFLQLYFVIHYCCENTGKVCAPNAVRRLGAPHMYWPHEK